MNFKRILIWFLCLVPLKASAYHFTLSPEEFAQWDTNCQALYISTQIGERSEFANRLPRHVVKKARKRADDIKSGGWHYCAGLIYLKRYKLMPAAHPERARTLKLALGEAIFSARKVLSHAPEFLEMNTFLADVYVERKEYESALKTYNLVIQTNPNYLPGYLSKSMFYNKVKDYGNAISTLKKVPDSLTKSSAEYYYFLGLFYFKNGDLENAQASAKRAYQYGYPLPGLKNMLKQKGITI